MPEAGVRTGTKRFDLKSLPPTLDRNGKVKEEGGYVELRRLNYGEVTQLQKFSRISAGGTENGQRRPKRGDLRIEMSTNALERQVFLFSVSIVDHNLLHNGKKLDLSNPDHVQLLAPSIADNIEDCIDELNAQIDDGIEDDELDPTSKSGSSSSTE